MDGWFLAATDFETVSIDEGSEEQWKRKEKTARPSKRWSHCDDGCVVTLGPARRATSDGQSARAVLRLFGVHEDTSLFDRRFAFRHGFECRREGRSGSVTIAYALQVNVRKPNAKTNLVRKKE